MFEENAKCIEAKKNEVNRIEFNIIGNVNDIVDWESSCSCAGTKIDGTKFIVSYMNDGAIAFHKTITVYIKDKDKDVPLKKLVNGIMDYNPEHKKEVLHIVGIAK